LHNLELRLLPIEELPTLGLDFDLIISTGVLHHMADPLTGLKALADCLRPTGAMGLMLYATLGRAGVYVMQSVFRDMGLTQDEASLAVVKDVLANLEPDHPVQSFFKTSTDWHYDAGLVDLFLHGRDRSYSVDDCLDFVAAAGLVFQGFFDKSPYYLRDQFAPQSPLTIAINALPERKMWSVMERLTAINGTHSFMACRPERPKQSYTIDFSARDALNYVPLWRPGCGVVGSELLRMDFHVALNPAQLAFAELIDGHNTIGDVAERMAQGSVPWQSQLGDLSEFGRKACRWLWCFDAVAIATT
jgi:hypothetical protein